MFLILLRVFPDSFLPAGLEVPFTCCYKAAGGAPDEAQVNDGVLGIRMDPEVSLNSA